jgi:DNA-binding beta-propeller fold protein YncE
VTTQESAATLSFDYVKTIGIVNNGNNGRGFANPYDIAFRPDGRIFVLNRCDPARASAIRVGVCNLDEDYLYEFGNGYGQGEGQFIWPVAMAFDRDDRLFITDEYNNRVCIYDADGKFVSQWGEGGSGPGKFDGPAGIAIDSQDCLYIADQQNGRVQKLTTEGELIAAWGEPGSANGQFDLPWGVGVGPDDSVYVADWRNDRVQKFSCNGEHLQTIGSPGRGPGELSRPSGVAIDLEGVIAVADWGNERIQVFAPDGSYSGTLRGQATVSKWAEDYYSSNPEEWELRKISQLVPEDLPEHLQTPYHTSSQVEPYFWGPVAVRIDGDGRMYVVETNRHRFQVYRKSS